jgi:endonuclease/exonuclease/phosphatase family metal-dependent hydrolase
VALVCSALEQCSGSCRSGTLTRKDLIVASWNIHKGVGRGRTRDLDRTSRVIVELGADILALQEADTRYGTRTGLLNLAHLEQETGLVAVPLKGVGLAHGWHGNVILVREGQVEDLHQINLPGLEPRGALIVDLSLSGRPLRVIAAHLGLLSRSRRAQVSTIMEHLSMRDDRATLMMGDLNEWRVGRSSPLAHLEERLPQAPVVRSYPARLPVVAFDRIMACTRSELLDMAIHDTPLARQASDHLPVRARLRLA